MKIKKWITNGLYFIVTLIAFSLSVFKLNNPVWIAAWIAPVFLIRFMRNNKWIFGIISSYLILQTAVFIGIIPFLTMTDTISVKVDFSFILMMQIQSGMLFLPLLFLVPFILDKALNNYLPGFAASLVYPTGVTAVELFSSLTFGTLSTFGETQFALPPLAMISSLFGFFGVSFLVAWSASMINYLWEENWNIKKLKYSGLAYVSILTAMLIYGGTVPAFPKKAEKNVSIAGITLENGFFERMAHSDM